MKLAKIKKRQENIIANYNLKGVKGRYDLGNRISEKLGKKVILLYDEDFNELTEKRLEEERNKGNDFIAQAIEHTMDRKMRFGSLTCIIEHMYGCKIENMYGRIFFDTKRNKQIESEIMAGMDGGMLYDIKAREGKRLFFYICFSCFDVRLPKELVEEYKSKYFSALAVVERREKVKKILTVV